MWPPHSFFLTPPLYTLLPLLLATRANTAITTTTIDDTDESFTWSGEWTAITPSSPCDFCASKPDPSETHGGTWHDGNYMSGKAERTGGSFTFTGHSDPLPECCSC
ncbi:hypothetical protein GGX14DRAFT_570290 [Mycena pura]|uniref:Uncharacterized protein n=1 Tax=Mycena pura TaxID=153505 RepID=A0AAD6V5G1_9AGAR|nr:hypothetical protein GGX14DRAFT_570290 [Mycena pura]